MKLDTLKISHYTWYYVFLSIPTYRVYQLCDDRPSAIAVYHHQKTLEASRSAMADDHTCI